MRLGGQISIVGLVACQWLITLQAGSTRDYCNERRALQTGIAEMTAGCRRRLVLGQPIEAVNQPPSRLTAWVAGGRNPQSRPEASNIHPGQRQPCPPGAFTKTHTPPANAHNTNGAHGRVVRPAVTQPLVPQRHLDALTRPRTHARLRPLEQQHVSHVREPGAQSQIRRRGLQAQDDFHHRRQARVSRQCVRHLRRR
jgi:hypothetical protein